MTDLKLINYKLFKHKNLHLRTQLDQFLIIANELFFTNSNNVFDFPTIPLNDVETEIKHESMSASRRI